MKFPSHLWTIGHSTRTIEEFIQLLKNFKIEMLADVRSYPFSKRLPHFNKENLTKELIQSGIEYLHFPQLGGRRSVRKDSKNNAWESKSFRGYADHMGTEEFMKGIENLNSISIKKRTAIMCAEALWWRCHRSLISDYMKSNGVEVIHIMNNNTEVHPYTKPAQIINGKLSYRLPALF